MSKETQELLDCIKASDTLQLTEFMCAIVRRHKQLHPNWDLVILPLPIDPNLREKEIEAALPLLRLTSTSNRE